MDYQLHHEGQNLGRFPLEELRRRRRAGELTGREYVWREGMADWETLDAVLQPGAKPPRLPTPKARRSHSRIVVGAIVLAILLVLAGMAALGYRAFQLRGRIMEVFEQAKNEAKSDASTRPIAWSTNSLTQKDTRQRAREFRLRQWLEGYKARGQRASLCDAESVRMIEAWIAESYGDPTEGQTNSVADMCDRLTANPECNDPLVLTAAGVESIEVFEKIKRLERALAGFPQSRHRAYPKFYAAASLAQSEEYGSPKMRTLDASSLRFLREAFSDGSFSADDEGELADIFITGWGYNLFYRAAPAVTQTVKSAGKSYEWLSLMLEGEHHVMLAWQARGGGYANTVKEDGWKGFSTNLAAARHCFSEAWRMHPERPLAAARMVYVELGEAGAPEMRLWFDRAVAAQFDHESAWSSMRWGLRPRWHGSLDEMLAFGRAALGTGRFDTDVPRKFFDVVKDLESEMQVKWGRHIYGRRDIWPDMKRMYEGYIAEPSEAARADGWRTTFSIVAYFAGKYDVAREQLEAVHWQPWPSNLNGWGADVSLMAEEVAACTGPLAGPIATIEGKRQRGQVAEAIEALKGLAVSDGDERTRSFIRHRLASLEQEARLANGRWVDLLPAEENDPGWRVSAGKPRRLAEGAVEVEAGPRGHLLNSRARVGPNFEVKGEFELVHSSTADFQAGLVMGLPELENSAWLAFRMKGNRTEGDVVTFSRGWSRYQSSHRASLRPEHNSFQFRLQGGKATAFLNGVEVLRDAFPGRSALPLGSDAYVGLGAYNDMNDTVIRYRNVQIRRLAAPVGGDASAEGAE